MEKHREKIEYYGGVMENMGFTPVAARVFVYILLSPDQQVTFEDLVAYFNVSKSAVSNALKMLTTTQMVESKTIGGQRKRYFSVNFDTLFSEEQLKQKFTVFHTMLDDIKTSRGLDDEFGRSLGYVANLYKMMIVELPIIIDRWKRTIEMDKK
ncbi:MAG: GbsR/MarR family transcriptional regulator [Cytophagaceae bacterium]